MRNKTVDIKNLKNLEVKKQLTMLRKQDNFDQYSEGDA